MKKNSRGRPRKTDGKRFDKPVYVSKDLHTKLVNAACAEGFSDWREWITIKLEKEDNNVTT